MDDTAMVDIRMLLPLATELLVRNPTQPADSGKNLAQICAASRCSTYVCMLHGARKPQPLLI